MTSITPREASSVTVDVRLGANAWNDGLRADALAGLTATPKVLSPTWLYDDVGSALYDEITRVDEYYPARTELTILDRHADDLVAAADADTLVELGSGTSHKTRRLLDAMRRRGALRGYVPIDASEATVREAAAAIAAEYGIAVHAVVGDFRHHLDAVPKAGTRLFAFLGGTIGNFEPIDRRRLLERIVTEMDPGDTFVVGTDLLKDRGRLVRAYDDAAGVTAAFNKNVLRVLNREFDGTFEVADFDHVALFDEQHRWIEMRLRARRDHDVRLPGLGLQLHFDEGEELRTEISAKFALGQIDAELGDAGLVVTGRWTDVAGDFALTLAVR